MLFRSPALTTINSTLLDITYSGTMTKDSVKVNGNIITVTASNPAGDTVTKTVEVVEMKVEYEASIWIASQNGNVLVALQVKGDGAVSSSTGSVIHNGGFLTAADLRKLNLDPSDITVNLAGVEYTGEMFTKAVDSSNNTVSDPQGCYEASDKTHAPNGATQQPIVAGRGGFIKVNVGTLPAGLLLNEDGQTDSFDDIDLTLGDLAIANIIAVVNTTAPGSTPKPIA